MRALTLTQPWASLVALGLKRVETRSWSTNYRGTLAIHAAKGMPPYAREFASEERAIGRLPAVIPRGAIVAVARLTGVVPTDDAALEVSALERRFGDYGPGRYAWFIDDVRILGAPVPCRGALGLWAVPEGLLGGHRS